MNEYTINWLSLANRFADGVALMAGMMLVVVLVIWLTGGFKKKEPVKSDLVNTLEDQIHYLKVKLSNAESDLRAARNNGEKK